MKFRNQIWLILFSCILTSSLLACGEEKSNETGQHSPAEDMDQYPAIGDDKKPSTEDRTQSENGLFFVKVVWGNQSLKAGTLANNAMVRFSDLSGEHVPVALKSFKLFMVSMGHGSIKEEEMLIESVDDAHWEVKNIYFSMGGTVNSWAVDIEAEVNGQTDRARVIIEQEVE